MVTWQERNSDHLSINLILTDETRELIKKRHLEPEEIQFALYYAETANDKMYDPNDGTYMAKCIVGEGLYFVEYKLKEENGDKAYDIITAYACRTKIKE